MVYPEDKELIRRQRLLGILLLAGIAIFTVLDIIGDLDEGSSLLHMCTESLLVVTCVAAAIHLWLSVTDALHTKTSAMGVALSQARNDAIKWREANAAMAKGLTDAIEHQLKEWGLSEAQREIAFLLIKGLSFKEIAEARHTSEHTVRQQAAVIYRKSGLEGRAQLSAFFLEDLFAT